MVSILADGRGVVGKTDFANDVIPVAARRALNRSPEKQRYYELRVMRALAGTAAHDLKYPRRRHDIGDQYDHQFATELLDESLLACSDEHLKAYLRMLKISVHDRLRENWSLVEAVVATLLERNRLTGDELLEVLRVVQSP
jgi:hypothetical protein